jgi:hypothetical protein
MAKAISDLNGDPAEMARGRSSQPGQVPADGIVQGRFPLFDQLEERRGGEPF